MSSFNSNILNSRLVSIGMPVYNGEKYIGEALEALLNQDYDNLEIVICDNASEDSTAAICENYSEKDPRIKYFKNSENLGPELNFQRVLDLSVGEYFMWASHDDIWSNNYVSTLIEYLELNRSCVLAYSSLHNVDDSGSIVREFPSINLLSKNTVLVNRLEKLLWFEESQGKANLLYGIIRANIIKKIGTKIWNSYGSWGSDYLIVFNLALYGDFIFVPNANFYKRLTQGKSVPTIEYLKLLQGYFHGYRRIIESSELSEDSKILLLSSVSVKETQWYTREFGKTSFIELKDFIRKFIMSL